MGGFLALALKAMEQVSVLPHTLTELAGDPSLTNASPPSVCPEQDFTVSCPADGSLLQRAGPQVPSELLRPQLEGRPSRERESGCGSQAAGDEGQPGSPHTDAPRRL